MKTDWIAGLLGPWSAELAPGSILLRLALSMALAAIIGCERSSKRHSAGLRTFILVSLAGTATMLIDQYLMELLPVTIPVLSAAAVIGITTISANSILFSSKNQIKGLTTSVGLWCCGIVGLALGAGLIVSYVPQDASFLHGGARDYARNAGVDETMFLTLLRKLGFERVQFEKKMEDFSAGQKKKVLLAASLCQPAHLYVWDEPLNFVDLHTRLQITSLLRQAQPTMLFVEHDRAFQEEIATQKISL